MVSTRKRRPGSFFFHILNCLVELSRQDCLSVGLFLHLPCLQQSGYIMADSVIPLDVAIFDLWGEEVGSSLQAKPYYSIQLLSDLSFGSYWVLVWKLIKW